MMLMNSHIGNTQITNEYHEKPGTYRTVIRLMAEILSLKGLCRKVSLDLNSNIKFFLTAYLYFYLYIYFTLFQKLYR